MPWRLVRRFPWATLRGRLTLLNTAVVLLASLLALVAVRAGTRIALYREADAVLRGEVNEVAFALRELHPDTQQLVAELRRKAAGHAERGWFTQLLTDDGTTIWKSFNCPPEVVRWPVARDRVENLVQVGDFRFARRRISDPDQAAIHVRIGMPTAFLEDDIDALTRLLLPVGLGMMLLTPLAGYWLALRATRPVAEILARAEQLRPTRLGDRLAVYGSRDELDRLALTINRLLDQVAGHVERQQQFVADAAHELRGPLAAMQSSLEVAISQDREAEAYRDTLADVLEESRHLAKVANDLLLLAEVGDDTRPPPRQSVDLGHVARQAVGMFAGVGEDRGIAVELRQTGDARVAGDASQLRQVLGNLLDNALRFTPPGGRVTVTLAHDTLGRQVIATVADTGAGIEPEHLGRVFDRFYKVDPTRPPLPGRRSGGLGLAICKSIVERHGGRLSVTSDPGLGATFTIQIPAAA